jgi:three-Cys-motif partner protein
MKIPASKYTKEKQAFLKSFTQDLRRLKRYEFCIDVTAGPGIYAGIRGSPIVLSESLPGTKMLFIEKNAEAFLSLNKHIVGHISKPNRVSTFLGDYNWVLPRIMTGLWDVPGIIYVDPCGYLDFSGIKNLCKSSSYKNMDILINFSTAHSSRGFRSYPSLSECIKKLDRKNAFATPSTGGWTKVFLTNSCGKDIMDLLRQHDMYDFRKESAKKLNV